MRNLIYLRPILDDLSQGSRIKFIRMFRHLTQDNISDDLGITGENKRRTVTRYETNKRVPSEERLKKLRKLYRVNINSIKPYDFGSLEDSIYVLLWMEELYPNSFKYFEIVEKYPKEKERIMMRFSDEWKEMREKRANKEITMTLKIKTEAELLNIESNIVLTKANRPSREGGFPRETFN